MIIHTSHRHLECLCAAPTWRVRTLLDNPAPSRRWGDSPPGDSSPWEDEGRSEYQQIMWISTVRSRAFAPVKEASAHTRAREIFCQDSHTGRKFRPAVTGGGGGLGRKKFPDQSSQASGGEMRQQFWGPAKKERKPGLPSEIQLKKTRTYTHHVRLSLVSICVALENSYFPREFSPEKKSALKELFTPLSAETRTTDNPLCPWWGRHKKR